ncbi:hypothetical protein CU044_5868 [Streptomyces sp. L-9-10]|nr:hypothetical protein CU044_5868 [Streptomyces sp. L-9-10]
MDAESATAAVATAMILFKGPPSDVHALIYGTFDLSAGRKVVRDVRR